MILLPLFLEKRESKYILASSGLKKLLAEMKKLRNERRDLTTLNKAHKLY